MRSFCFFLVVMFHTATLRGLERWTREHENRVTVPISHEWKVLSEKTVAVI